MMKEHGFPWVLSLSLIFLLAFGLRLLYFPGNIYLGYDQARDLYSALSLLQGDLKIVGPPSSFNDQIFHGPLIYYIYAPFLRLFSGSPEAISVFLRIYNATGIFIVFLIGRIIFNKRIGLLAAILFAFSFEQSQYALFLGHPALAVIPVLLFYLGLALLVFKKEWKGLVLSAVSLGLASQFHYVHVLLVLGLGALLLIFRQELRSSLRWTYVLLAIGGFLLATATFLISEIKYGFRLSKAAMEIVTASGGGSWGDLGYGGGTLLRLVRHNFTDNPTVSLAVLTVLIILMVELLVNIEYRKKGLFLLVWLLGGVLPYVLTRSPSYYYGAGTSISLLIVAALALEKLWTKAHFLTLLLLGIIIFSNVNHLLSENKKGPNLDIVIQPQMLLSDEKQVLDYIYQQSEGKPISVKGLTVPLSVNTTWSYLFEWYGKSRYGYLPIWIGPIARGYPGNLPVSSSRSDLPQAQFLIIEPTIGIREGTKDQFFEEEGYFTKVVEEKQFGQFKVQKRLRY